MTDLTAPGLGALARVTTERAISPAVAYLLRCNEASKATMRYSLEAIVRLAQGLEPGSPVDAEAFPWQELRRDHVAAFRSVIEKSCASATANRHLAALRGVLDIMFDQRLLDADELLRCRRACRSVAADDSEPAGRMLSPEEVRRMLEETDNARDLALVALAAYSGLRREELSKLDLADVDLRTGEVTVASGKGKKRRNGYLGERARAALESWLKIRGTAPGALFWRRNFNGSYVTGKRLSKSGVWTAISTVAGRAGLSVTPHDFRRTFASTSLREGVDLSTVQKLMGHKDPRTTARYDRRDDTEKQAAAKKLDGIF